MGLCDYLYDLILFCSQLLINLDIKVSSVQLTVIFAMILMQRVRKWAVLLLLFISLALY